LIAAKTLTRLKWSELTLAGCTAYTENVLSRMAIKTRLSSPEEPVIHWPLAGASCKCLAAFFREEFIKHHRCLERQREYYSERAIAQAEDALSRILDDIDQLCQRDDACDVIAQLLMKIDLVTNLSAWTNSATLH